MVRCLPAYYLQLPFQELGIIFRPSEGRLALFSNGGLGVRDRISRLLPGLIIN